MSFSFGQPAAAATMHSAESHPFQYLQQCYDPNSPHYRFRFFFYNPGPAVPSHTKPPPVSERLWQQALADNPDHTRFHPVLASGFSDLHKRAVWQREQLEAQLNKALVLEEELGTLMRQQDVELGAQLARAKNRQ